MRATATDRAGCELVNGLHDTANATAALIYIHSMPVQLAIAWSGFCSFLGVFLSSGLAACGGVSFPLIELSLKIGFSDGFATVFARCTAILIWNLGT